MKKVVIKLNSLDDKVVGISKIKQNPMQAISSISGIISMEKNTKDFVITIIGEVDPVLIVKKLKKWYPVIDSVGDFKEKKPEEKPEEKPAEVKTKEPTEAEKMAMAIAAYKSYYPHQTEYYYPGQYYPIQTYDENPNGCVIC